MSDKDLEKEKIEGEGDNGNEGGEDTTKGKKGKGKKDDEGAEETVAVKKSDLARIMSTMEQLQKDNKILFEVADKNLLGKVQAREGENLVKQCRLSFWPDAGQFIIGWKLTKNQSEILPGSNRWVEDQKAAIILEDKSVVEMALTEFFRNIQKIHVDIVKITTDEVPDGKGGVKSARFIHCELPDGRTIVMDSVFVN